LRKLTKIEIAKSLIKNKRLNMNEQFESLSPEPEAMKSNEQHKILLTNPRHLVGKDIKTKSER